MARKPQPDRMEAIYQAVRANPGEKPGFIAQLLGLHRSEVTRMLPILEDHQFYLAEDENGGLWPFKPRR